MLVESVRLRQLVYSRGEMYVHPVCGMVGRSREPMVDRGLYLSILAPALAVGTVTWWW